MKLLHLICLIYVIPFSVNGYSLKSVSYPIFKPWRQSTDENCQIFKVNYTKEFKLEQDYNITMKVQEVSRRRGKDIVKDLAGSEVKCVDSGVTSGYCESAVGLSPTNKYRLVFYLKNATHSQVIGDKDLGKVPLEDIRGPLEISYKHFDPREGTVKLIWDRPWIDDCSFIRGFTGIEISCVTEKKTTNNSCFRDQKQSIRIKYDGNNCISKQPNDIESHAVCSYLLRELIPSAYYKIKIRYTTGYWIFNPPDYWSDFSNVITLEKEIVPTVSKSGNKKSDISEDGPDYYLVILCTAFSVVLVTLALIGVVVWKCRIFKRRQTQHPVGGRSVDNLVTPRSQTSIDSSVIS